METVFLALGTNLGDRLDNLNTAIGRLPPAVIVQAVSPVYETPPWGYLDQPPFLNQALSGTTDLAPLALLSYLKQVEAQMGRQKNIQNGPRQIDLDIVFYGERVVESPELIIPHPRLQGRGFVLVPLADLAPDLRHPQLGKTVRELLAEADTAGIHRYPTGQAG